MIYINLIPRSLWFINLRKLLSESQWVTLSKQVRTQQHWTCHACKISIKQLKYTKYFDCHEMWDFNDKTLEVELKCLLCLCKKCHTVTHYGQASIHHNMDKVFAHLCKINQWDRESADAYIQGSFEQWSQRSQKNWTMNWHSIETLLGSSLTKTIKANYEEIKNLNSPE